MSEVEWDLRSFALTTAGPSAFGLCFLERNDAA